MDISEEFAVYPLPERSPFMQEHPSDHYFADTPWSVFSVLRDAQGTRYDAALALVYRQYQPAVNTWLRHRGFSQPEAEVVAQDFTTEKLYGSLFQRADSEIGKFRTLLLRSLKNYVNDELRRKRVSHPAAVAAQLQDRGRSVEEPALNGDADREYDRHWALRTLEATLISTEESFRNTDQLNTWAAFEQRILLPIRTGKPRPGYAEVAAACGLRDARHAARAVKFVKHRCRDEFARQVAMVTHRDQDFREELAYYRQLLAMTGECEFV